MDRRDHSPGSVLLGLVVGGRDVLVGGRADPGIQGERDALGAERDDARVLFVRFPSDGGYLDVETRVF